MCEHSVIQATATVTTGTIFYFGLSSSCLQDGIVFTGKDKKTEDPRMKRGTNLNQSV